MKVKSILTYFTFSIALMGVFVAKANEKKRSTSTTAYYADSSGNPRSVTLDYAGFDDVSVTSSNQAGLLNCVGVTIFLYANQSLTVKIKWCWP